MPQSKMDFSLSVEQLEQIVLSHVSSAMIDSSRYAAQVRLSPDGALITVTRKRAPRKAKPAESAA